MSDPVLLVVLSVAAVALAMLGLGLGVLLRRRSLRGHCGGGRCSRDETGRKRPCDGCICEPEDEADEGERADQP